MMKKQEEILNLTEKGEHTKMEMPVKRLGIED